MTKQILWTASVTPFDKSGDNIDYPSLKKLLQLQQQAGNGVVLFGSTGEGLSLQDKERRQMLEAVLSFNLSIPIMVGVPSHNLQQALEWLEFCQSLKLAGYLLTTPIYTKPGIAGQTGWFETLLQKVNAPAMLYNIPSRSGIKLHPETVKNLSGHEKLWAIKDSSGSVDTLVDYKTVAPNVEIFCGDDNMMPATAIEGASGLVSVASNAWGTATRKYVEQCLKCKPLPTKVWWHSSRALFTASNPIPIKALLHHLGIIENPTVRLPLSPADLKSMQDLEAAHKAITLWEKNYAA